jgi:hypothetical protein
MSIENDRATVEDLYRIEGRAELIGGKILRFPLGGYLPNTVAGNILASLHEYSKRSGMGDPYTCGIAYVVTPLPSGRETFSPSVSYFIGQPPSNPMHFIEGPPTFAVEVREENDFGSEAEIRLATKRADYFAAGTAVVWDVDPIAETVSVYRPANPDLPVIVRQGDVADAKPAVPAWRMVVSDIFEE